MLILRLQSLRLLLVGFLGLSSCGATDYRSTESPAQADTAPKAFQADFTKRTGVRLLPTFPEEEDKDLSRDLVQLDPVGALEGPTDELARTRRLFGDFSLYVYRPGTSLLSSHLNLKRDEPRWTFYRFATPGPGWSATTRIGRVVVEWVSPTKRLDSRWRRLHREVQAAAGPR